MCLWLKTNEIHHVCVCVSVCLYVWNEYKNNYINRKRETKKNFSFKMKTTRINGKKKNNRKCYHHHNQKKKNHPITIKMIIILFRYTKWRFFNNLQNNFFFSLFPICFWYFFFRSIHVIDIHFLCSKKYNTMNLLCLHTHTHVLWKMKSS